MVLIRKKVVQNSDGSYVVIVPKWWMLNNKLKKGDLLNLNVEDDKITITTCKDVG